MPRNNSAPGLRRWSWRSKSACIGCRRMQVGWIRSRSSSARYNGTSSPPTIFRVRWRWKSSSRPTLMTSIVTRSRFSGRTRKQNCSRNSVRRNQWNSLRNSCGLYLASVCPPSSPRYEVRNDGRQFLRLFCLRTMATPIEDHQPRPGEALDIALGAAAGHHRVLVPPHHQGRRVHTAQEDGESAIKHVRLPGNAHRHFPIDFPHFSLLDRRLLAVQCLELHRIMETPFDILLARDQKLIGNLALQWLHPHRPDEHHVREAVVAHRGQ